MICYSIIFLYLWHMKFEKSTTIYLFNIVFYCFLLVFPGLGLHAQSDAISTEQGVYRGKISKGEPHGHGVMSYNNGDKYER